MPRSLKLTRISATSAAAQVGMPSAMPNEDDVSRTRAAKMSPANARRPEGVRMAGFCGHATWAASELRERAKRQRQVAAIATADGSRKMRSEDDEVGRIGDGQQKAGGVGDQGAGEQIGLGVDTGAAHGGKDGGREHDGGCVVREQSGDGDSGEKDEQEEPRGGIAGAADGVIGEPVKDALVAGQLGEQHHAGEKKVDVSPLAYCGERGVERDEPRGYEKDGGGADPDGLA